MKKNVDLITDFYHFSDRKRNTEKYKEEIEYFKPTNNMEDINVTLDEEGNYSGNFEIEHNDLVYRFDLNVAVTWYYDAGTYWQPPESYVDSEDIYVDNIEVTDKEGTPVEFNYKEVEKMISEAVVYE